MKRSVQIVEPGGNLPHIKTPEASNNNTHVTATNSKYQQYINSVVESQRKLSGEEGGDEAALSPGRMADADKGSKAGLSDLFRNRVRPPCTANGVPVQSVSDYIRSQESGMRKSAASLQAESKAVAALPTKLPGGGGGRATHKPRGLGSATTTSNYFHPKYELHQYNVNLDQDLDGKIVEEAKAILIGGAHGANHVPYTPPPATPASSPYYKYHSTPASKSAVDVSINAARDRDGNRGAAVPAGPYSISGGYTGSFINANDEPASNSSPHTALRAAGFRGGELPTTTTGSHPPLTQQHGGGWLTSAARSSSPHSAVAHHDRPQTGRYLGFISEAINHPLAQRRLPSNLHPHLLTGPSPASQQYKSYVGKVLTGTPDVGTKTADVGNVEKSPVSLKRPHTAVTTTPPHHPATAPSHLHATPKSQQGLRFALDVVTPLDLTPTDYGRKVPTVKRPSTTGGMGGAGRLTQGGGAVPVREVILPPTKDAEGHDVFNTGGIDAAAPPHDYHFV